MTPSMDTIAPTTIFRMGHSFVLLNGRTAVSWSAVRFRQVYASDSIVEGRQVEIPQARGIGEDVDRRDLPLPDREADDGEHPFRVADHDPRAAVHLRGLSDPPLRREAEPQANHVLRAAHLARRHGGSGRGPAAVEPQDDVGV